MRMTALFFFLISLISGNQSIAQSNSERMVATYESERATCQIATFRGIDISQACNGIVIFSPEMNALLIGIGDKSLQKFFSFSGEFTKQFYSFQGKTDYPLVMNVTGVRAADLENQTSGQKSICFFAATNVHKSVMIRCLVKNMDGTTSELLVHVDGLLE